MSTRNNLKQTIYFEAPNFGFGPISTAIILIEEIKNYYDCILISTGGALKYAKQAIPNLATIDFDTFDQNELHNLLELIPIRSLIISNTNPEFASWAKYNCYRIGIFDNLFWMWESLPGNICESEFYLAPRYYGKVAKTYRNIDVVYTSPLVRNLESVNANKVKGNVIISFGGMSLPYDPSLPLKYAKYILDILIPILLANTNIRCIKIIGGHPSLKEDISQRYICDDRIDVIGFLPPIEFQEALIRSELSFLTPGLSTLHEIYAWDVSAFILPGYNMSMILQAFDISRLAANNRTQISQWEYLTKIISDIRQMSERQSVKIIASYISDVIKQESNSTEEKYLCANIYEYIDTSQSSIAISMIDQTINKLPCACDVVISKLKMIFD